MSARILIIEDNPNNLELMAYLLTAFGYKPMMAKAGIEGVALALRERPDLILCDVHLPGLDGYAVVSALRKEPALAQVPIIASTAMAMTGDREKLIAAGFDGYIAKPIEPETLVAQLEAYLPKTMPAPEHTSG